jgi:hypothetical protein
MKLSTLAIARDLESAGFTKAQAESIAEKFIEFSEQHCDELVTKDYLKAQLAEFKTQLAEFKTQLADLSVEIKDSHINAIKWLVGLLAGFLALMCSFIYFLVK